MKYILIIGANSDIAKELAIKYANNGYSLYLIAKNIAPLKELIQHIKVTTQKEVLSFQSDIMDTDNIKDIYEKLQIKPEGVIISVGYLGVQEIAQTEIEESENIININYTKPVSALNIIANDFEKRKDGFIIGISSVAGDRGRKSNYIYGSSKAGFTEYLSGLRNRLYTSNINVITVKAGFVNTKMTAHLDLPENLTIEPKDIANKIYMAQRKKKEVVYIKGIWKYIMLIIKLIPESIFKKTNI